MVREDIVGGLRNAIERGETVEEAKQSFLNASYPEDEIDNAMSFLRSYQEEVKIPEEIKKKADITREEIKETKDINELKKQEIKESLFSQQNTQRKKQILKYSLIGGGVFVTVAIITLLVLYLLRRFSSS